MQVDIEVNTPEGKVLYGYLDSVYDVVFPTLFDTYSDALVAHRNWWELVQFCPGLGHERQPVTIAYDEEDPEKTFTSTYCPTCKRLTGPFEVDSSQCGGTTDQDWWGHTYGVWWLYKEVGNGGAPVDGRTP